MDIDDQQRFCARWLDQRGIYGQPTLQQLMEMAEAWAAYRLRLRSCGAAATEVAAPDVLRTDAPAERADRGVPRQQSPDVT